MLGVSMEKESPMQIIFTHTNRYRTVIYMKIGKFTKVNNQKEK